MTRQKSTKSLLLPYLLSLFAALIAFFVRKLLDPLLGDSYLFITLYAAVAFSVWSGGAGPAILVAIVSYVAIAFFLIEPRGSFERIQINDLIGTIGYFITAAIIIAFGESIRSSERKIKARQKDLEMLNSKLQERIEDFNTLLKISPMGVWIGNHDCSEVYGNPAAYKMFGFKEGINASITSTKPEVPDGLVIHVDGKEVDPDELPMQRVARTGQAWHNFEHDVVLPDGSKHVILGSAAPLFDQNGKVRQIIATYANYNERKELEEALKTQHQRSEILATLLRKLLAEEDPGKISNEIFLQVAAQVDADCYFNYMMNEDGNALDLQTHYGISDETADSIRHLKLGEVISGTVALTREPIIANDIQNSTYDKADLVRGLGFQTYVCNPLTIGSRLLGTLAFASKTRKEFREDELEFIRTVSQYVAIAINRLHILNQERAARKAAEDAARIKDEFLATVSHELRTPLHSILGWSHLLQSGSLGPKAVASAVGSIYSSAKSQAQIIDDLLDVARITSGKMTLTKKNVLLSDILKIALDTVTHAIRTKNLQLQIHFDPQAQSAWIQADPKRLQQVFWNLLSNAVKFTPVDGSIHVHVTRSDENVSIAFRDSGIGIKPDFLPFVFERFRQADSTSTRRVGGLGLGLSISRDLIALHGGSIKCESQGEGKGTVFTILLPCVEQSQAAADLSRTPLSGQPQTNVSLPFSRVLLVDDDLNTLQILNEAFRNTRAEISTADSAVKALEIAKEWNPDLLISDLAMPGRDGYWLIRQLRPDGRENATGCAVALTASATQEERTRALAAGFDTVLSKPMEPGEVLRMAKLLLRQQSDRNQMFVETKVSTKLNQTISVLTGKKILLVEDDVISAALLSVALEQKGMELKSATRASEALDILQDWCPDAIISDLGLPDEDGFSMIQKIRSFPGAKKDVPALALTGYGNEEGDRALQAGFQNYKTKPVDPDSVVHLLMQMLNHY